MKKLIFNMLMLTAISGYADQTFLKPLWEEDQHFAYYRVLCIEGSVGKMGTLIQEARENPKNICGILDQMEQEVQNCKNCL